MSVKGSPPLADLRGIACKALLHGFVFQALSVGPFLILQDMVLIKNVSRPEPDP